MPVVLPSKAPRQYTTSKQLIGGDDFNAVVAALYSEKDGLTATAGGGQAGALQLNAAVNTLAVVANANDSVKLPNGFPGLEVVISNAGANSAQIFTRNKGTINGTDGIAAGVALANNANAYTIYTCMRIDANNGEIWLSK